MAMEIELNKKTILEEAVSELKSILSVADKNAKDRIAKELPKKFDSVLKEELNKLDNKESVKESIVDIKKEPVIEGRKSDKKKESLNETDFDMRDMSINDVEEVYDEANTSDEFQVVGDDINLDDIEKELGEMEVMNDEINNVEEESNNNHPYEGKVKEIYEMLGQMVKEMDNANMHETYGAEFGQKMTEMYGNDYENELGESVGAMYEKFIANKSKVAGEPAPIQELHDKGPNSGTIDKMQNSNLAPATIKEEDSDDNADEEREEKELDETGHGSTLAQNKVTGADQLPKPENAQYKKNKYRYALRKENWQKRMTSLLSENKKVSKELSNKKLEIKKVSNLVGEQKTVLLKYRNQLQEMAIFNTNLAHVNNLFVNESLALTVEDKKDIVNKFKGVASITESEKTYKAMLIEMSRGKKTIVESVEDKVNNSIEPSSAKVIVEQVSEKTGFAKNEHVNKIKSLMEYVDNHGKKIIK